MPPDLTERHRELILDVVRERPQPNPDKTAAPATGPSPTGGGPPENAAPAKRPRGRPRKDAPPPPPPPSTRLQRQYHTPREETEALLAELPRTCGVGSKTNAKGHVEHWPGYKFPADVGDRCFPLLALTPSASLHDSQVAMPMSRKTAERLLSLYDLMEGASDADYVVQNSMDLKHVPIIDPNRRRGPKLYLEPDRQRRYGQRSESERFNSRLKDNHGGGTCGCAADRKCTRT